MTGPHADAITTLEHWQPEPASQESLRQALLAFLIARDDACLRACVPGHITASAVLLDHAGEQVLLTLHPLVGRWLQLGGHCEPEDETLVGAALREATEESGIDGITIDPMPLHADVHPVTCSLGVPTRHLDVRFLARAPRDAKPVRSAESMDLRWWPLERVPYDGDLGEMREMIAAVQRRLVTSGDSRVD